MAPPTGYDDDDFVDQYDDLGEEEEELSPEDKVAMQNGTAEVRKALGTEASKVTVAQIQEALWHYYYDVDKSVAYLTKTFIAPAPKPVPKKAPEGKPGAFSLHATQALFSRAFGADCEPPEHSTTIFDIPPPSCIFPLMHKSQISPTFFDDMPWLDIPKDRETVFIEPPRLPGGLLGGSSSAPKMSKLQALAALRKKKTEEKKDQEKAIPLANDVTNLSLSDDTNKENLSLSSKLQSQNIQHNSSLAPTPLAQRDEPPNDIADHSLRDRPSSQIATDCKTNDDTRSQEEKEESVVGQSHAPSAFARTLFGSVPEADQAHRRDVFAMPYTQSSSFLAKVFSEPSPDDIVLAAQSKGSNFAKAK